MLAVRGIHGHGGYLRWRVSPDRRIAHEAEIVAGVGAWIGDQVLGAVGAAMAAARPATVRVVVPTDPPEAAQLMFVPLELGHSGGQPPAAQNVTLVMQHGADGSMPAVAPVGERLRVLGLFSATNRATRTPASVPIKVTKRSDHDPAAASTRRSHRIFRTDAR
jgi:hypothetical protein